MINQISEPGPETAVDLNGYTNLRNLDLCETNVVDVNGLEGCPNLTTINLKSNQTLDSLKNLPCPEKVTALYFSNGINIDNEIPNLILDSITKFKNLEKLNLPNINCVGSLKALGKLTKLKELNICHTKFTQDLEWLPSSIEVFYCLKTELEKVLKQDKYGGERTNYANNLRIFKEEKESEAAIIKSLEEFIKGYKNKTEISNSDEKKSKILLKPSRKALEVYRTMIVTAKEVKEALSKTCPFKKELVEKAAPPKYNLELEVNDKKYVLLTDNERILALIGNKDKKAVEELTQIFVAHIIIIETQKAEAKITTQAVTKQPEIPYFNSVNS